MVLYRFLPKLPRSLQMGSDKQPKARQAALLAHWVPCFELWLLLHFEDVLAPIHRNEVYRRLLEYLPGYAKGQGGQFDATRAQLATATQRAARLGELHAAHDGEHPFTDVHRLVGLLTGLKAG